MTKGEDVLEEVSIQEPDLSTSLSPRQKSLRDKFVEEYLIDRDSFKATVRVGYSANEAKLYHNRFMQEAYVLQQIRLRESSPLNDSPEDAKNRVMLGLLREANYHGTGCSQSARVAALSKIASILGMDAPTKNQNQFIGADGQPIDGGFFVVPGILTAEEWEKQAAEQQAALVAPAIEKQQIH